MAPKKPRQAKPVREVINQPSRPISGRTISAARQLQATVKGSKGATDPSPNGTKQYFGYHPPAPKVPLSERKPLPTNFNIKPDGTLMNPQEVYDAYVVPGTYDITQKQLDHYAALYIYADTRQRADAAIANNPISQAMQFIDATSAVASDIPGLLQGDSATLADANQQATIAMNVLRRAVGQPENHLSSQTQVGGTRGTPRPVDRSAANKKAWETRKKLYGSSGQKEK